MTNATTAQPWTRTDDAKPAVGEIVEVLSAGDPEDTREPPFAAWTGEEWRFVETAEVWPADRFDRWRR